MLGQTSLSADPGVVGSGVAVAALLALSAFFSGSEIAIFTLERHRLDALVESGDPRAAVLGRLREDPHRLLVTILVGNNVVNVAMTAIATAALTAAFGAGTAAAATTVGMSFLVLLFGEITPKSYGVARAEHLALAVARPIAFVQRALHPLVALFDTLSGGINRLTGGGPDIERPYVTREEIEAMLRTGERVGAIDGSERDMVQGVFDLSSTTAREVMVPRADIVAVEADAPLSAILEVCSTERLTRVPVYEGTLDHVVGIADIRDVERAVREGLPPEAVLLPTLQAPDTREIDDLLAEMQAERVSMVIVRDEFGETEGLITVEDILEEIVGEIFEVGEERFIRPTNDGLVVKGEVTVGAVNDVLGTEIPREGDFETVAGLINAELGRIGDIGDRVVLDDEGVSMAVEAVDGHRIRRVRVRRLPRADDSPGDDVAAADGPDSSDARSDERSRGAATENETDADPADGGPTGDGSPGRDPDSDAR